MPLIRIVSYLNYVNMIRILLPLSLLIPGTLWKSFRISTFLKWISLCKTAILFLILTPESFLNMSYSVPVSVEFQIVSYTKWSTDITENHLHAILSGFPAGDTPDVGTFVGFFSWLWIFRKNNFSNLVHPPKTLEAERKRLYLLTETLSEIFSESLEKISLRIWITVNVSLKSFMCFFLAAPTRKVWLILWLFSYLEMGHLFIPLFRSGKRDTWL